MISIIVPVFIVGCSVGHVAVVVVAVVVVVVKGQA